MATTCYRLGEVLPRVIAELMERRISSCEEIAQVMGYKHRSGASKIRHLDLGAPRADRVAWLSNWLIEDHGITDVAECFSPVAWTCLPAAAKAPDGDIADEACRILELDGSAVRGFVLGDMDALRAAERDALAGIQEQQALLAEIRTKIDRLRRMAA